MPGVAFDTNVLAYAAGLRRADADEVKIGRAEDMFRLFWGELVIPAQTLAELRHILRRRARWTATEATAATTEYGLAGRIVPTDQTVLDLAFSLTASHGLQTYDAIILAAVASAGCDVLYSEDMQDGFHWEGISVVNPFT